MQGGPEGVRLRPAEHGDTGHIRALVNAAGINPSGLAWKSFVVACISSGEVFGCGQIRRHHDGLLELASVAVEADYRGRGIGAAIVRQLLAAVIRPIYLICRVGLRRFYIRFDFAELALDESPRYFKRFLRLPAVVSALRESTEPVCVMKLG
jgi:N-acetylglutamate synthase-like GNAT family acetyltransferase